MAELKRRLKMDDYTQRVIVKTLDDKRTAMLEKHLDTRLIDDIILRVIRAPHRKLYLSGEDYKFIRDALNELRNELLATGHYTDGVDETMIKMLKAPYRKCREK